MHGLGDGASWIAGQVEKQCGAQGHDVVDRYHVCEYLRDAAAALCPADDKLAWIEEQKALLKANHLADVLTALLPYREPADVNNEQAPVRRCYRYLHHRSHQWDYKNALANDLPLGSGEIESAHRYIVQNRIKIAGAWWKEEHTQAMLALPICRAKGQWEDYWKQVV